MSNVPRPNNDQRRFFVTYFEHDNQSDRPAEHHFLMDEINGDKVIRMFFTREEAEAVALNLFPYIKNANYRLVFVNESIVGYQSLGPSENSSPPEKWSGVA